MCLCETGLALQQDSASGEYTCVNIDECADENLNDCDPNAVCVDTIGSFECRCKEEDNFRGNGKTCVGMYGF